MLYLYLFFYWFIKFDSLIRIYLKKFELFCLFCKFHLQNCTWFWRFYKIIFIKFYKISDPMKRNMDKI